MISNPVAQAGTALSPEWDRGFDEAFTELICGDPDLLHAAFDALIGAAFDEPPTPPAPPSPSTSDPEDPDRTPGPTPDLEERGDDHRPRTDADDPRAPP